MLYLVALQPTSTTPTIFTERAFTVPPVIKLSWREQTTYFCRDWTNVLFPNSPTLGDSGEKTHRVQVIVHLIPDGF